MIFYATKKTVDTYKIELDFSSNTELQSIVDMVLEKDRDSELFEWGVKLLYFDRKKCLQFVHFASKFTIFLFNIKKKDINNVSIMLENYIMELFKDDVVMLQILPKFLSESPVSCFAKLTNKSIISQLNRNELYFAYSGDRFYDYIHDGILHTVKINKDMNFHSLVTVKKGKQKDFVYPAELFRDILISKYYTLSGLVEL